MDGASAMKALLRIVLPLDAARPGRRVHLRVHDGVGELLRPLRAAVQPGATSRPPSRSSTSSGTYGSVAYGKLAAFSILYATPVLALYLLVQRFSGGSFAMAGAVKG